MVGSETEPNPWKPLAREEVPEDRGDVGLLALFVESSQSASYQEFCSGR